MLRHPMSLLLPVPFVGKWWLVQQVLAALCRPPSFFYFPEEQLSLSFSNPQSSHLRTFFLLLTTPPSHILYSFILFLFLFLFSFFSSSLCLSLSDLDVHRNRQAPILLIWRVGLVLGSFPGQFSFFRRKQRTTQEGSKTWHMTYGYGTSQHNARELISKHEHRGSVMRPP